MVVGERIAGVCVCVCISACSRRSKKTVAGRREVGCYAHPIVPMGIKSYSVGPLPAIAVLLGLF